MKQKVVVTGAALVIAICAGAWSTVGGGLVKVGLSASSPGSPTHRCAEPARSDHYVGLSVPGFPPDASKLTSLERKFQLRPSAISLYMPLGMNLNMSAVDRICAQGALPVIEIDSDDIPLNEVAGGRYDAVLASYAEDLKRLDYPVGVNFDHEFNSPVWGWGTRKQTAANFIAAWRHIVRLFKTSGAYDITWIWNPATDGKDTVPIQPWYPGNAYVTWVGLDGYFVTPQSTFHTVFGPTLTDLKAFTRLPVFIDETGANTASQRVRAIYSLFSGVENTPLIKGLIWFDYGTDPARDWRIEDDPSALAVFHAEEKQYSRG